MNKSKNNWKLLILIIFTLLYSSLALGATSIEMTTADWINIFGNINMSYNDIMNIGNASISGNLSVGGNLSVDGSTLFVDAESNRVGIGTTSPETQLGIYTSSDGAAPRLLELRNSGTGDGTGSYIGFHNLGVWSAYIISTNPSTGRGDLTIQTRDDAGTMQDFYFSPDGKLGIGATVPNATLFVQGNATIVGNLNVTGTSYLGDMDFSGSTITAGVINVTDNLTVGKNIDITNGSLYQPVYGTDDGLVLYLPFSENLVNVSNTTYDRSPYGNDGTLVNMNMGNMTNGTGWSSGKYGNGMEFSGDGDYVDVGNDESLNLNFPFSLEAWFKSDNINKNYAMIMGKYQDSPYYGYAISQYQTDGKIWFVTNQAAASTWIISDNTLTSNRWYHVVGTYDGAYLRLYIDGVSAATPVAYSTPLIAWGSAFKVGITDQELPFDGSIDEVRVYSRVLAPEEIRTHYLRGSGFGASGAITANKFRIVNTSGNVDFIKTSAGNVGIGTAIPNATLDVQGNVMVSRYNAFRVISDPTAGAVLGLEIEGDAGIGTTTTLIRGRDFTGDTALTSYNIGILPDGGNVGIGTASPGYPLHVRGADKVASVAYIQSNLSTGATLVLDNRNQSGDVAIDFYNGSSLSGNFGLIQSDNNPRFFVLQTNPYDLDFTMVEGGGNVGIGTASPGAKLEVAGDILLNGTESPRSIYSGNSSDYLRISAGDASATVARVEIFGAKFTDYGGDVIIISGNNSDPGDGDIRLGADLGTFTEYMRITNTGEVGIGATIPNATLFVQGNTTIVGILNMSGNKIKEVDVIYAASTSNRLALSAEQGKVIQVYTRNLADSAFVKRMEITGDADIANVTFINSNVGIGTSSPNHLLDVNGEISVGDGSDGNPSISFASSDTTGFRYVGAGQIGIDSNLRVDTSIGITTNAPGVAGQISGGSTDLTLLTTGSADILLTPAGNVGIGTTTPGYKLHVSGTDDVIAAFNSSSTTGQVYWQETGTLRGIVGYGDNAKIFTGASTDSFAIRAQGDLHLGGGGDNLVMTIDSSNVGIGTTRPDALLTIVKSDSTYTTPFLKLNNTQDNDGSLDFYASQDAVGGLIGFSANLGITSGEITTIDKQYGGGARGAVAIEAASGELAFWTTGTSQATSPRMTIDSSGNVGIGTATPLQTLVVVGTVNITDSLNVTNNIESGGFFIGDGSLLTGISTGGTSVWNSSGSNVYLNDSTASVGIGTNTPNEALTVIGNINVTGNITSGSSTVFIDGTNSRVGIGTASPTYKLDVVQTGSNVVRYITTMIPTGQTGSYSWDKNAFKNMFQVCQFGTCCQYDTDCDGDGKTYAAGNDCDEGCSTCYVGSGSSTSSPDGKDQDCDSEVDDMTFGNSKICILSSPTYTTWPYYRDACIAWCSGQGLGFISVPAPSGSFCYHRDYNWETCTAGGNFGDGTCNKAAIWYTSNPTATCVCSPSATYYQ